MEENRQHHLRVMPHYVSETVLNRDPKIWERKTPLLLPLWLFRHDAKSSIVQEEPLTTSLYR